MATSRWLGLDLGGTNIKVAVLADDGSGRPSVVATDQRPAGAEHGPETVVANLGTAGIEAIARWGPVDAVGVGVPGLFDDVSGAIEMLPNLPGPWQGVAMTVPLTAAFDRQTWIINDARAFTLAEFRLGAAAGCDTVATLVLGTGIGGGIVVGGRLHFGRLGRAGELSHQIVIPGGPPCTCGNHGCLEAVAAGRVLSARGRQATPREVFAAAAGGDELAATAIAEVADCLGIAIANIITVLVPERVVIGGGVAEAGDALLDPVRAAVGRHCVLVPPEWYEIVPAALGPYAGAIGAALWASERRSDAASR